jgi:hypothetical protein
MQPDPLAAVKEFAERYSIPFDDEDAALLVVNRLRLAANPTDPEALRIARHFSSLFYFGKDDVSFADFATQPRLPVRLSRVSSPQRTLRAANDRVLRREVLPVGRGPVNEYSLDITASGTQREKPINLLRYS